MPLLDAHARLPKGVPALDWILDLRGDRLVPQVDYLPRGDVNLTLDRIVGINEPREQGLVIPSRRGVEVDDWRLKLVSSA